MAWSGDGLVVITVGVLLPLLRAVWLSPGRFTTIQALDGGIAVAAQEPWLLGKEKEQKKKKKKKGAPIAAGALRTRTGKRTRLPAQVSGEAARPAHLVVWGETSVNKAEACGGQSPGLRGQPHGGLTSSEPEVPPQPPKKFAAKFKLPGVWRVLLFGATSEQCDTFPASVKAPSSSAQPRRPPGHLSVPPDEFGSGVSPSGPPPTASCCQVVKYTRTTRDFLYGLSK